VLNGQKVRCRLREQGKTQRELATHVGTDASNITKYLNGRIEPRGEIVEKIAIFLGVPIDAIWLYTTTPGGGEVVSDGRVNYASHREISVIMMIDVDSASVQPGENLGSIYKSVADPDAYGILLTGISMSPLIPPGSRLIVSPNAGYREGRLHLIKLGCGETYIRRVVSDVDGYILIPFNNQFLPLHIDRANIEELSLIIALDLPG